ncbi:MAG: hypothetical protein ACI4KR_10725 [Ruminiclostridium sp.]
MLIFKLLSLGSTSAAEGFGSVFIAAICGLGALALMYAVLVIMNKIHDRQEQEKSQQEQKAENMQDCTKGEERHEKAVEEGTAQKEEKAEEKNGL